MFAKIIAAIKNFFKAVFGKASVKPQEAKEEVAKPAGVFDPAKFTMPARSYQFTGVLGRGDDQDKLKERFGTSHWRKVPGHDRVFFVNDKTRDLQLTLLVDSHGEPIEFAVYTEKFAEFKEQFGKVTFDCTYHKIDPVYKYMGLQVVEVLKAQELW